MRAGKSVTSNKGASTKNATKTSNGSGFERKRSMGASSRAASNFDDNQSYRSQRSTSSRVSNASPTYRVHHEDPSASMNPTEAQWNEIVQKNL
jgi:hypothetical protein